MIKSQRGHRAVDSWSFSLLSWFLTCNKFGSRLLSPARKLYERVISCLTTAHIRLINNDRVKAS